MTQNTDKKFEVIGEDGLKEVQAPTAEDAYRKVKEQVSPEKVVEVTPDEKILVREVVQE